MCWLGQKSLSHYNTEQFAALSMDISKCGTFLAHIWLWKDFSMEHLLYITPGFFTALETALDTLDHTFKR